MTPDDFKRLVAAGLSTDQIAIVMEIMDRDARAHVEAEEARKAKGRDRAARWRAARNVTETQRNVTETQPNVTVTLAREDARVEEKPLPQEIEPQQQGKGSRARRAPTPREALSAVLDDEHAAAVIDHRNRLRKPLTERAATLVARNLATFPDPNAAADRMISRGWLSIEPGWGEDRHQARAGPAPKPLSLAGAFGLIAQAERDRDQERPRTDEPAVLYLPGSAGRGGR